MHLQHRQNPNFLRETRATYLLLLRHSVEHIGHIKELAYQAREEKNYAEAWMWHCLMMMFGYGVRAGAQRTHGGHEHLREAIRRHDLAFKLSLNEEHLARELAQFLFDEMGTKKRRKLARHNHQLMIQ